MGKVSSESVFFEWVTALHRSLFLHELGRFFVGLTAFLLLLITLSGIVLIIQRQGSFKRFFSRIVKDSFTQYYHVVLGRLLFVPMIIIALSGMFLSLQRFEILKSTPVSSKVDFDALRTKPQFPVQEFELFKSLHLSSVELIEFPFSEDVEDYFTLKLYDKEITVNQLTGDVLTEQLYDRVTLWTKLSLSLHTGQSSAIWAIVLGIAALNILFFIYSGFAMTLKRRQGRIKNKYTAGEADFILLVGSENGSTFRFAKAIHEQLLKAGKQSHMAEMNAFTNFPAARQLIVFTSTYGQGEAPTNAAKFLSLIEKSTLARPLTFSVVAFGSHGYPDFCKFGYEVYNALSEKKWAKPLMEIHTVNDRSPLEFEQWANQWAQLNEISLYLPPVISTSETTKTRQFEVTMKSAPVQPEKSFIIRLKTARYKKFSSGDLLALYPANDHRERLYSIGKIGKEIQLSVKVREGGLGSEFLNRLTVGQKIRAAIVENSHFHFPQQAKTVVMISNGTGIAPFLGMIHQYGKYHDLHLYCGFRNYESFQHYEEMINLHGKQLTRLNVALSREGDKQYVKDLLSRDGEQIVTILKNKGVLMICGSLQMQKDVLNWLAVCLEANEAGSVSEYQSHGQILTDCY
ncbi:sulfite reductase [NADPH] flavoprotein, alpha-component [compost metagenome]